MIPSEARGAWHELEARLRPYVRRRVASDADADDALQEIFVRIHRGLPSLRDGERFGGWVYRVAEHVLVDSLRANGRQPLVPIDEVLEKPDHAGLDVADPLQVDLGQCVALFVARLPSPYRQAVTLTELEGLTQRDAADMLGISLSGMKSRVQRGRERIRDMFAACCRITTDARGRVMECEPRGTQAIPAECLRQKASADP